MGATYYVYMIRCNDGSLYTGMTNDLDRRFQQHKEGTASRYTRARGVTKMVFSRRCGSRSAALKREAAIKKLTRAEKLALIDSQKRAGS